MDDNHRDVVVASGFLGSLTKGSSLMARQQQAGYFLVGNHVGQTVATEHEHIARLHIGRTLNKIDIAGLATATNAIGV